MNDPVQKAKSNEINGKWFRWTNYDLLNAVIIPAEGAQLQSYDPWDKFRFNVGKYRTVEQPYTALLELDRKLKEAEIRNIRPSELHEKYFLGPPLRGPQNAADELILQWCNEHGLLGLVSILSNNIRLTEISEPRSSENERFIKWNQHYRVGGAWSSSTHLKRLHPPAASRDIAVNTHENVPGVSWFDPLIHTFEFKPLRYIRAYFLPTPYGLEDDIQEQIEYPCPNTAAFWKLYGEPVSEFTHWVDSFASTVKDVSRWTGRQGNSEEEQEEIRNSYFWLSGLAQHAAPAFRFTLKRNSLDEERVSAGLLASYALMFLWDRIDGRRAFQCQNCELNFVSDLDIDMARYCSQTCRNTAQKRRSRAKANRSCMEKQQ